MHLCVFKKRIHTDEGVMVLSWDDTSEQRTLALVSHNSLSQPYKSPCVPLSLSTERASMSA